MPEIFQFEFMQRAFIAGIMIAVVAPMIGQFLVVKRYSLMADTLAHVSLVGVALGIILNINPVIAALVVTVIASIGIEKLRGSKKIFGESVLALFLSGSLAIAVVMASIGQKTNIDLFSFLFGSITTVSQMDVYTILMLGTIIILGTVIFYKHFFLIAFDEELAVVDGVKTKLFNMILIVLTAITVSLAMRVVGILLVGALMVIPVITALQFGKSFQKTIITSIILAIVAVILGLIFSFYFDLASGGTIVIVTLIFFAIALLAREKK